ncbi:MAG: helix-turn-helix domain-containing protein [Actinomycetota bacterium]|nr:helix-turn-helix domain-containing protein [Actinomycetota bacterium]
MAASIGSKVATKLAQGYYRNMSSDHLPSPTTSTRAAAEGRELTDPRTMRALTHPVRLALLEVLLLEGPVTATQAGELIDEPPNTCSFHLRQLAKYGFVEEAGPGPGRNRPWRLTSIGMHFSGVNADSETRLAARGLQRMLLERYLARVQDFFENQSDYPPAWREASGASEFILHVSPDELQAMNAEIATVLNRYRGRLEDSTLRPVDSAPVQALLFAYPLKTQKQ